jgi:hypothetical protein
MLVMVQVGLTVTRRAIFRLILFGTTRRKTSGCAANVHYPPYGTRHIRGRMTALRAIFDVESNMTEKVTTTCEFSQLPCLSGDIIPHPISDYQVAATGLQVLRDATPVNYGVECMHGIMGCSESMTQGCVIPLFW